MGFREALNLKPYILFPKLKPWSRLDPCLGEIARSYPDWQLVSASVQGKSHGFRVWGLRFGVFGLGFSAKRLRDFEDDLQP